MTNSAPCVIPNCTKDKLAVSTIPLCRWHLEEASNVLDDFYREIRRIQLESEGRTLADKIGCLYFVRVGERIKIGFSVDPRRRLRQYPPGTEVLAIQYNITLRDEQDMHGRLTQYRVAGREWYRDSDEIQNIIAEIVAKTGKPAPIHWGSGHQRGKQSIGRGGRPAEIVRKLGGAC